VPVRAGPSLGFDVSNAYLVSDITLTVGQTLLAYTDGITEAFDPHEEAFGEARLRAALDPDRDACDQCVQVLAQVRAFVDPAPQSDDITVLALRLTGAGGPLTSEDSPC